MRWAPEVTSFFGRGLELTRLTDLLDAGERLISILGPAGVGKTRVAQRLLLDRQRQGETVFFCDVRGARDTAELCDHLARALELQLASEARNDVTHAVGLALAGLPPRSTLVIDNYEHLVSRVEPETLGSWLAEAPDVRFIVTTRRRLRLQSECVFDLPPLPLPQDPTDVECESVNLFVDRACAVEPSLQGSPELEESAPSIASVLDGMPLALELAAGLARRSTPAEILEQLRRHQLELCARHRDADPRHASLRAAIASSWEALGKAEQRLATLLTVFQEGFTRAGADAVSTTCDAVDFDVGDALEGLRDASLIRPIDSHETKRWDFFEATREYASEQFLLRPDAETLWGRVQESHARFMAKRGERWRSEYSGVQGLIARRCLKAEQANLSAAAEWAAKTSDAALSMSTALSYGIAIRDQLPRRAADVFTKALAASVPSVDQTLLRLSRAQTYGVLGRLESGLDDLAAVREREEREDILAAAGLEFARLHLAQGNSELAGEVLKEALPRADGAGSLSLRGRIHRCTALWLAEFQHDDEAFSHYAKAIECFDNAGDVYENVATKSARDFHRLLLRKPVAADDFEHQLDLARRLGNRWDEVRALLGLGILEIDSGIADRALAALADATQVARVSGLKFALACCGMWKGIAHAMSRDETQAAVEYSLALDGARELRSQQLEGMIGMYYAPAVATSRGLDEARHLLSRSVSLLENAGDRSARSLMDLQTSRLDLLEAAEARRRGALKRASALVQRVKRRGGVRARGGSGTGEGEVASHLLHASFLERMLGRALADTYSVHPSLRLWRDGSAFQLGERPIVSLGRGAVIRRVLAALGQERVDNPGHGLDADSLLRVGWPDQSMLAESGTERLKTVIKRLRRAGLRDVLRTEDGSYLLDPSVPVEQVS